METVYIETTIVSYLVARPSRDLIVAAHQQLTRQWWEQQRAKFACFIPEVVLDEVRDGEAEQAALRLKALEGIPRLAATVAGERLAAAFLEGALPLKAAQDAAHPGHCRSCRSQVFVDLELYPSGQRANFGSAGSDCHRRRLQAATGLHTRRIDGSFPV